MGKVNVSEVVIRQEYMDSERVTYYVFFFFTSTNLPFSEIQMPLTNQLTSKDREFWKMIGGWGVRNVAQLSRRVCSQ